MNYHVPANATIALLNVTLAMVLAGAGAYWQPNAALAVLYLGRLSREWW